MFRNMPLLLILMIVLTGFFEPLIPYAWQSNFYGVSLSIKSIILFALPFVIFGLLFKTAAQLVQKSSSLIIFLVLGILVSNFFSTMISYNAAHFSYGFDLSLSLPSPQDALQAAFQLTLPKLIGNDHALFAGLLLGGILGWANPGIAEKLSLKFDKGVTFIMKGILYLIPLFILGFILKMFHDGVMFVILKNYTVILALVCAAVYSYIAFLYLAVNRFQINRFLISIKNMVPAAITGFGSMSSAAAMPVTIIGTEKNARNKDIAKSIIPATVNVHLMGDCFAIPIFAFAVLKNFGAAEPTFFAFFIFACYFVIAKFSVAAVPGGGILVMLPILESQLGYTPEMLSLITALYVLFDPVISCANVLGNGAFAMIIDRLSSLTQRRSGKEPLLDPSRLNEVIVASE